MKANLSVEEGMSLLRQYCNFQERCHQEVRHKGLLLGFRGDELEFLISRLISEGLLDEERYAKALARGKFRNNQWGKVKIIQALKQHDIPAYCIQRAMLEIPADEYEATLTKLIEKKKSNQKWTPLLKRKIIQYLQQKGFEYDLIAKVIDAA
jgi:regulatory protein